LSFFASACAAVKSVFHTEAGVGSAAATRAAMMDAMERQKPSANRGERIWYVLVQFQVDLMADEGLCAQLLISDRSCSTVIMEVTYRGAFARPHSEDFGRIEGHIPVRILRLLPAE
jgi:hypothetical protein